MNRIARWRLWLGSLIMGRRGWTGYSVSARATGKVRPFVRQAWMGAPEDELGVAVPVQKLLSLGSDAAVLLMTCIAYSTGFQLTVGLRKRHDPPPLIDPRQHREMPEMRLEIVVRFADGRETSNSGSFQETRAYFEAYGRGEDPPLPPGPILAMGSGGGGGRSWIWNYFIWPLPPDGPVTVKCRWPVGDVPDGQVEIDGAAIRSAGESSAKLWT